MPTVVVLVSILGEVTYMMDFLITWCISWQSLTTDAHNLSPENSLLLAKENQVELKVMNNR